MVRGRIKEGNTVAPVPGVLVSLVDQSVDTSIASALSDASGEYALRAPAAGRYRLAAKRIGVRRFLSAPFDLMPGETRVHNVALDAIALALPEVNVSGLCVNRTRDLRRIASLWDEARTALEATEISQRDRLIRASISRYAAEVDPPSLRTLFDWRSDTELMVEEPFTSLSGDSLSAVGYWRQLPGDSVEFLAPDARALASNAFIRDHCFGLAATARDRPGMVGLTFGPARDRRLADISGTIWLDARLFELRLVEFRYTRLPPTPDANRIGGEVHFARLTSGAWIVDRWFIRMPQLVTTPDEWPRRQLREEGGSVVAGGKPPSVGFASVRGVVRDSSGRPLSGAVVRALGTSRQVVAGQDGSYRIDSLPPGSVSVVAHTDGYDSYAALAASRRITLRSGRVERLDLRAPDADGLRREFCPVRSSFARSTRSARGVLRLLMVDSATTRPLPGVRFLVTWPAIAENPAADSSQERNRQAVADSRGAATFCDLPAGIPLEVSVPGDGGLRAHVMMAELARGGVMGRVVMGRIAR